MKRLWLIMTLLAGFCFAFAQEDEETTPADEEVVLETIEEDYGYASDTTDIDLSDIEEDELGSDGNFPWQKFTVGGALGPFQFGNFTNLGASPEITYTATPFLRVGAAGVYEFYRQRDVVRRNQFGGLQEVPDFSTTNYGGRAFLRVTPLKAIFAHLEYERLERETPNFFNQTTGEVNNFEESLNNVNLGLGLAQAGVDNGGPYVLLLYNLMHRANEDEFNDEPNRNLQYPYNAIDFRGGINIPLGRGDKNKKREKNKKRTPKESDEENN